MKGKYIYISIITVAVLAMYQNCAPTHTGESQVSSSGTCSLIMQEAFSKTIHPWVRNECSSCHIQGGLGKGAFAQSDLTIAYNAYELIGEGPFREKSLSNHQSGKTGPQVQALWDTWKAELDSAKEKYQNCLQALNEGPSGPAPNEEPNGPRFAGANKALPDAADNGVDVSWNLQTEMAPGARTINGATLTLSVRTFTVASNNQRYFEISQPRLTAGPQALRIRDLRVNFNNTLFAAGLAWRYAERWVPATLTRPIGTNVIIIPVQTFTGHTLAPSFRIVENVVFAPPTFAQLQQQVLNPNCVGCHGAVNPAGGLNLTNYNAILARFVVSFFDPEGSELYIRMSNANAPMPPAGLLPEAQQKLMYDWIKDGAPAQ